MLWPSNEHSPLWAWFAQYEVYGAIDWLTPSSTVPPVGSELNFTVPYVYVYASWPEKPLRLKSPLRMRNSRPLAVRLPTLTAETNAVFGSSSTVYNSFRVLRRN